MNASPAVADRRAGVVNQRGLHAPAAALLARTAGRFEAAVTVAANGERVSALSIMGMLMLGASTGTTLQIEATGDDAAEAAEALAQLIENGFEEEDFPGY